MEKHCRQDLLEDNNYCTHLSIWRGEHAQYLHRQFWCHLYSWRSRTGWENMWHRSIYLIYLTFRKRKGKLKWQINSWFKIAYGLLSSCQTIKSSGGEFCIVQRFESLLAGGSAVTNDMECPLIMPTHRFEIIESRKIIAPISMVHECSTSCRFQACTTRTIERQTVTDSSTHDKSNNLYSINIILY